MKKHLLKISASLLLVLMPPNIKAQEALTVSGTNVISSGGSVCYSVGQIVYTSNVGSNGSIIQGVQQPFEIIVVTTIEKTKDISLQCSAFPNPTTNFLKLLVDLSSTLQTSSIFYKLYDSSGKLLENKRITTTETSILMDNLMPATYFLKIIKDNEDIKTFKINKK